MQRIPDPQAAIRKEYVQQMRLWNEAHDRLAAEGLSMAEMASRLPAFDSELFAGLTCGARTRQSGRPCRMVALGCGGRCRLHGGKSTGPKTPKGRAVVTENLRRNRVGA